MFFFRSIRSENDDKQCMSVCQHQGVYSVMQSDGNSFYGDVISDSFHKASPDEDKIYYNMYIEANMFGSLLRRF